MDNDNNLNVIVSNGLRNFHLSSAASESDKRGTLKALFTGIYPNNLIRRVFVGLRLEGKGKLAKLFGRRVQINETLIHTFLFSDVIGEISWLAGRFKSLKGVALKLNTYSMEIFANSARNAIKRTSLQFKIYHYRAGFGSVSLVAAKAKGAILLCDHSIAHPLLLDKLIDEDGQMRSISDRSSIDKMWQLVLADIEAADHVVVNSDFVKKTFDYVGFPSDRLSVIYLGVDDTFAGSIPRRKIKNRGDELKFLFAGAFSKRKGAEVLLDAMSGLPASGWVLSVAGTIEPHLESAFKTAQKQYPIQYLGNLTREQLALAMSEADIFVFPSLAEGSARVIFESMACGCFIITTPNAGSIVRDRVHGYLIEAGSANSLLDAMNNALKHDSIARIGAANAELIAHSYTQRTYGEKLAELYKALVARK